LAYAIPVYSPTLQNKKSNKSKKLKLRMKYVLFMVCLLSLWQAEAQKKYFNRTYTYLSSGSRVVEDTDKNFITIGGRYLQNLGVWERVFLKTNAYGDSLTVRQYPEYGIGYFSSLLPTEYGYAISGYLYINPSDEYSYRGFLLKIDENGNPLQFAYTGAPADTMPSNIYAMLRTPDGGYIMAGHKINEWVFPNYWKFYLVKLNADLQTEWEHVYDNYSYSNIFSGIAPAPDGGYMLWGPANLLLAGINTSDLILAKVDANGIMEWDSIYNLEPPIHGTSTLTALSDGNFIALAASGLYGDTQRIIKFAPNGVVLWQKYYYNYGCGLSNMVELPNGELVFTNCYYPPGVSRTDMAIFKLSATGSLRWWRRYGNPGFHDYGYDIKLSSDGGFVVAGRQDTLGGSATWIVRTNCMGLVTPEPKAAFSWQADAINPFALRFENHSQYAYADSIDGGKYIWDWGDGTPLTTFATEAFTEVYHYYATPGTFTVTLRAIVCQDTSMVQALVSTTSGAGGTVGVSEILASDYPALKVYPNPAREEVHFELAGALQEEQHEVILFDYTGKAVQHFIISGNRTYTLKTNALSSGIYFYRVLKQGLPVQHGKLVITQ